MNEWPTRVRTGVPIYALSAHRGSLRRMALYRGVYPIGNDFTGTDVEEALSEGIRILAKLGHVQAGDRVIMTMGEQTRNEGGTNSLRLVQVGEGGQLEYNPSLNTR